MKKNHFKIAIIGAGTGGVSVAAKLNPHFEEGEIVIIDSSDKHYYQPWWTLAGVGLVDKSDSERSTNALIPKGVQYIRDSVSTINPDLKKMTLLSGQEVSFDYLVVAVGLKLSWEKIQGIHGQLGKNGICSVYQYDSLDYTAEQIQNFKGGRAIFVMPPTPIKCAGAPQKVMYLAENIFRQRGVRSDCEVIFATAGKAMFGIPVFSEALTKIVNERGIKPLYQHKIVAVDPHARKAIFEVTDSEGRVSKESLSYDLLHVVPPMSAPSLISESKLSFKEGDQKGWLAVDKHTLQHLEYPFIFGIGDVTGIPNSKTGAAIRKQYPIVSQNILDVMNGQMPSMVYDGYSSCPLTTEIGKVMLAEFGYDGKLLPSFPLDPAVPRRSYWLLKKQLLPKMYWHGMLKGLI